VRIFSGGSLIARDVYIQGNVDGDRGDFVNLDDTDIDGNVKLEEFVGDLSVIQNSNFRGNVELRRNRSRFEIVNSSFYSNLHAVDGTGGLLISGNSVGGHLQCSGNDPAPTGLGNLIDRDASGQCEDLAPEETSPTIPPRPTTPTTSPPPTTVTPPPTTVAPPATVSPPPSAPATPEPLPRVEKEGLGALDWSAALLLLPLLAWRRFRQRRRTSGA
jgi:hypothetical protein